MDTFIIEPTSIIGEVLEIVDNLCFGENAGSVSLGASGGSPSFEYSVDGVNFQADSILTDLEAGDYIFTIRDSEGCIDTVTASISQPTEFIIDPGQDLLLNLGFDTTLTAVSNYRPTQFLWGPDSVQCLNFDCSRVLVMPFNSTTYVVTGINRSRLYCNGRSTSSGSR